MQQLVEFVTTAAPILSLAWIGLLGALLYSFLGPKGAPAVNPQEATLLMNKDNAKVLDIRTAEEFNKGHILGASHISFNDLQQKGVGELEKQKENPIIVVCATGSSASRASSLLKKQGFSTLYRLKGGMLEWQNAKLPVSK
ncbi:rhodanese-like domain-containing protein [Corallincola platygyrae]|uniref:Rhodanese-like domain-containing protein n=1 Tax=Corallincola platygyrae TaxID=1193278 RepID=A0ABW4XSG7_9GAMM